MVKNYIKKKGFSLTEVLVATIVMSMIMTGVLGFVQYGGEIWHRGQKKMNIQNYNDMAFQLLKDDLQQADKIIAPKRIDRTKLKASKSITYRINETKYKVSIASGTLQREQLNNTQTSGKRTTTRLARNVKGFFVYRISTWTVEVSLQIQSDKPVDNKDFEDTDFSDLDENVDATYGDLNVSTIQAEPEIVSSETMILLAPGVK